MNTIKHTIIFCLLSTLGACNSVTTTQQTGNTSSIVANANSKARAIEIASTRARHICQTRNQALNITDFETNYQGAEPDQQDLINVAKTILPLNKTSGAFTTADYDYKATLTFHCV